MKFGLAYLHTPPTHYAHHWSQVGQSCWEECMQGCCKQLPPQVPLFQILNFLFQASIFYAFYPVRDLMSSGPFPRKHRRILHRRTLDRRSICIQLNLRTMWFPIFPCFLYNDTIFNRVFLIISLMLFYDKICGRTVPFTVCDMLILFPEKQYQHICSVRLCFPGIMVLYYFKSKSIQCPTLMLFCVFVATKIQY